MDVDAVFAALADPTRRAVIGRLAQEPAERLRAGGRAAGDPPGGREAPRRARPRRGWSPPAARAARLRYALDPEPMGEAMAWMASVGAQWDERLARLAPRAAGEARSSRGVRAGDEASAGGR